MMKRAICALAALALLLPLYGCGRSTEPVATDIHVAKVEGLADDFVMGADVSSVLSELNSGVVYYGFDGQPQDIMTTLKQAGLNYIRIRVWNDPYDAAGNGYGGGNCDIETAVTIGKMATQAGLKVLIDFHYSDFWADPSKQMVPKAWAGMDINEKKEAIAAYTSSCLQKLSQAGVNVGMVQIGNETTTGMAGEKYWYNVTALMQAASQAVRQFSKKIAIAVHFTDPENGKYKEYAFQLDHFGVDYDIFASSYYAYWHGSYDNLVDQLSQVAETYNKKVMIAETSYAYSTQDYDGQGNTIGSALTYEKPYPLTVQGQANALADVIAAAARLGDKAVGVFYWEPAWITVPADSYQQRQQLWEQYGSGWASSYAAEYDPADAGVYYGGSAVDNQALFDAQGHPLASLKTFSYVYTGTICDLAVDDISDVYISVLQNTTLNLPDTVQAVYNDNTVQDTTVEWDLAAWPGTSQPLGTYTIYGMAGGRQVSCYVTIAAENYVVNGSFEQADTSMWTINNLAGTDQIDFQDKKLDAKTGSMSLHFWDDTAVEFTVEQKISGLTSGTYTLQAAVQGGDAVNPVMYIYVRRAGEDYQTALAKTEFALSGWVDWQNPVLSGIECDSSDLIIGAYIKCDGGWGTLDDFVLSPAE